MPIDFDVLAERGRVCVALAAPGVAAFVGLLYEVGSRVLEAVRRVGVGLPAPGNCAHVRLFSCNIKVWVRSQDY